MANYKWDLNELRQKKEQLILMAASNKDSKKAEEIQESIWAYEDLIKKYHINRCVEEPWLEEEFDGKILISSFLEEEYSILSKEIIDIVTSAVDVLAKYTIKAKDTNYEIVPLNNDELMEVITNFYETIPVKDFKNRFYSLSDKSRHLINIQYCKKGTFDDAGGFCTLDTINHIPYANILRTNTICDIIIGIHEIMHMIVRKQEIPLFASKPKELYGEFEGVFADLLSYDFLRNRDVNTKEVNLFERNFHYHVDDSAINIVLCDQLNKTFDKNGKFKIKAIKEYFKERNIGLPITKKNIGLFLPDDIMSEAQAIISYLIALDLYQIYRVDPEKGIYILNKLQMLNGIKIRKELEKLGLTFFQDGFVNLDQRCKQIVKQRI